MKKFHKLNSNGDTIVEVLIVLTILSFSFAISYAVASGGLNKSQTAQEHSQALGMINSQLELVRTAINKHNGAVYSAAAFCMNDAVDPGLASAVVPTAVSPYPTVCQKYAIPYKLSIIYHPDLANPSKSYFEFSVKWDGIGSQGPQSENLTYKMQPVELVGGILGPAYQGGGGAPYVNNQSPPPPPPPPPPVRSFVWSRNGINPNSCVPDPSVTIVDPSDINDRCQNPASPATYVFARRIVNIKYLITGGNGTLTGNITAGPATLTINYNQWGTTTYPPAGYTSFKIRAAIDSTALSTTATPFDLPIEPGPLTTKAYYSSRNFSVAINIPTDNPGFIQLDWINNQGSDPDLQINSVTISYNP